jgi:hypothetical protein
MAASCSLLLLCFLLFFVLRISSHFTQSVCNFPLANQHSFKFNDWAFVRLSCLILPWIHEQLLCFWHPFKKDVRVVRGQSSVCDGFATFFDVSLQEKIVSCGNLVLFVRLNALACVVLVDSMRFNLLQNFKINWGLVNSNDCSWCLWQGLFF